MIKQFSLCVVVWITILGLARTDPTTSPSTDPTRSPSTDPTRSPSTDPTRSPTTDPTKSPFLSVSPVTASANAHELPPISDSYNHYRICEGSTAHFSCGGVDVLHIGGCWYGSPEGDPGIDACPHSEYSSNGYCTAVIGQCVTYTINQCEGRANCNVTVTDGNMGGDPCSNKYKFLALALRCDFLPVTASANAHDLGHATDGHNHYRICEGSTAQFSCGGGNVLHIGGCWYGAPEGDPGIDACPPRWEWTSNVYCAPVIGECVTYTIDQCEGEVSCHVTATDINMGGDYCSNKYIYKFLALAINCQPPPILAKSEFAGFIDNDEGEYNYNYGAENNGYIVIAFIICLVLLVNIAFLCHHNCRAPKSKTRKYRKVSQFASSDDAMQNLKECKN